MSESNGNSQNSKKPKPLTERQFQQVKEIFKAAFLMRLEKKGMLKPGKKKLH